MVGFVLEFVCGNWFLDQVVCFSSDSKRLNGFGFLVRC